MARNLKEEVEFWNKLAQWAGNSLPKKKIVELKELFEEDGGLKSFVEKEIRRLIVNIKQGKVSLKNFTIEDADKLRTLLDCTALDQNLLNELSHLLYGADERDQYFKCWASQHPAMSPCEFTGLFLFFFWLYLCKIYH